MAVAIRIKRGTKANIESAKATLKQWEQVYATDTDELGIYDGTNIRWQSSGGGEVDLNAMAYFDYAGSIYGDKYSLLANAWESSLTVDTSEISATSTWQTQRGTEQYPNGETEGVIIPNSVTSVGNLAFYNWESNNQPLVIPNSVTSIGEYAFSNWYANNQPLVIPNSVTSIGKSAFSYWLSNTHPLVIPESITSIGEHAFTGWEANNHPLVIPESVTSIGDYAFAGWQLVSYVEIQAITPPTLSNANAFNGQNDPPIYVPDESVEAYKTATNWSALASRIFPISDKADLMDDIADLQENKQDKLVAGENITIDPTTNVISASGGGGIPEAPTDGKLYGRKNAAWSEVISGGGSGVDLDALPYMNYAANIYYQGGSQTLFPSAWQDMKEVDGAEIERVSTTSTQYGKLQYPNGEDNGVIIPDSVTSIGKQTFYNWKANNQQLVIPNSVTSIGDWAFGNWYANNQPLVIPNSVTSIGKWAFSYWKANNQPLVIPNSVTSIGNSAFDSWKLNNQPLVIPNSVTSIGDYAFFDWQANNQQLVIPNSVTSISNNAFYNWKANNQQLVIPNSVTSIGEYAFGDWTAVPYVEIQAITPPTLASSLAFSGQNDAPIYVPHNSVDDYKEATNWVDLADRIFPISDKEGVIGDIKSALDTILGV